MTDELQETRSSSLVRPDFGEAGALDDSLSLRVRGLIGSEILKIASEIRALVRAGGTVCNLTVGDFDARHFPIPAELKNGIRRALEAGETNYPPSDGVRQLREAVCEFTADRWGVSYPIESTLIASGARPILWAAYAAVVNPGDRVVYPVPSWNNNHYCWMTEAAGVAVPTRAEDGFMPTLEQLEPHLPGARMLCLNSPLNPAGTVIGEEPLRRILHAVIRENRERERSGRPRLFLLYDQVYSMLVFGSARHLLPTSLVPEVAPWCIALDGISKGFAATGLRVGWVLAAPSVVARMKDLLGHVGAWAPRPEQVAVAAFLRDTPAVLAFEREMNRRVRRRLDLLYEGIEGMKRDGYPVDCISPQGAIYLSLRLDLVGRSVGGVDLDGNEAIRKLLLDRAGVAVVPFQAFGLVEDTGWFRLSVGSVSEGEVEDMFPRLRGLLSVERGRGGEPAGR
jgi:aspartate aminotransferase